MSRVSFDRHERRVLLNNKLQNSVHNLAESWGITCNETIAIIVERYFRLPLAQRSQLESEINYHRLFNRNKKLYVTVTVRPRKPATKRKTKTTKTEVA